MYLEIDEGFDEHPKTVRLCRVMRDVNAGQYLIRLWAWACRSAQDGDLSGMEAADVEIIAKYKKEDGKLFTALTEVWSSKFGPWIDRDGDRMVLHGWSERTGAAIKKMGEAADAKRLYRLHRDGKCDRQSCTWCNKNPGPSKDSPRTSEGRGEDKTAQDKTSPDQSSPVQTRPDQTLLEEPLCVRDPVAGPVAIRPRTAHDLIHCLRVAVQREQPQNGMWSPGNSFAYKEADVFLRNIGDIEAALPDIEARIEAFAKDAGRAPWTVSKFVGAYNGIGSKRERRTGVDPAWREKCGLPTT
jgi:hypothetical protein